MAKNSNVINLRAARGRKAAIALIQFFEEKDGAQALCVLDSGYSAEPGHWEPYRNVPQRNILLEHIDRLSGDRDALVGFTEILTDFIATAKEGCSDYDYYEPFIATGAMEPRPAMGAMTM